MAQKATDLKDAGRETAQSAKLHTLGRRLTLGELQMVRAMFGTTQGFVEARIVARNMWWPYPNDRAITPNGIIFFPHQAYRNDYSVATVPLPLRALFMHEATHVYQFNVLKIVVFAVGPFDRNYTYELVEGQALKDYGLEQMGQIVQDFYTISNGGKLAGKRYRPADYAAAVPVRSSPK
jgi:hypothetical protein